MEYKELAERLKCPKIRECPINGKQPSCRKCQNGINKQAADAITDLLARAEAAERKAEELSEALSSASKVVRTMQENTIPYYRKRAEAAEKEVEWENKVIEAAERRFMAAEARAEKSEAERDAAVKMVPHECCTCFYHTVTFNGCTPDHDCTNPDGGCSNNYDRWIWSGAKDG